MTVLVCGGRDYLGKQHLFAVLDRLLHERAITRLVHGGARGADRLAGQWARSRDVREVVYPAHWRKYDRGPGKKNPAGAIRNQEMLETERPALVVAFPGGSGTAHMVAIARGAGVEIIEARGPSWPLAADPAR